MYSNKVKINTSSLNIKLLLIYAKSNLTNQLLVYTAHTHTHNVDNLMM